MKTFIINLASDIQKKDEIERCCIKNKIEDYTIIDAVNGKNLKEDFLKDNVKQHHLGYLTKGEIGCSLSHLKVYSYIIEKNIPISLILEDDVDIAGDIHAIYNKLISTYKVRKKNVYLLYKAKKVFTNRVIGIDGNYFFQESHGPRCTHGYFITFAAAKSILDINRPVSMTSDAWLFFYYKKMVKTYSLNKNVVICRDEKKERSNIEKERILLTPNQRKHRESIRSGSFTSILFKVYHKVFRRPFLKTEKRA